MSEIASEQRSKAKSLRPLATLVPFIKPYQSTLLLAMCALLISSIAVLAMPIAVGKVIDHGFSIEDATNVDRYFLILLIFALMIGFFGAARSYLVSWLGERIVADLRDKVFRHVIRMDPTFFEVTRIGEVLSRLTADTTLIQSIAGVGISILLRSVIQFTGALILLAYTNLKLMGILLVVLPLVLVPIVLIGHSLRKLSRETQDRVADASGHAAEILNAVETVQVFTNEEMESQRFGRSITLSFQTAIRRLRVRALFSTTATTGVFSALVFVLWIGAQEVLSGTISGGELGQFVIYAVMVGISGGALSEFWGELQRAAGAMERLTELLQVKSAIKVPKQPKSLPVLSMGQVNFDSVVFSYPSRLDMLATDQFTLSVEPGEHVALVGPSGAGKSTIFQLMLRFFDIKEGSIKVDNVDIAEVDPHDIRARVGIVPQQTVIFGESAMDNIRFGRPDATDEEVRQAAITASAHEFIERLPEGYNTFLGEKGARLSGGQKQRIAIARAVLKDPPILLLDEATSSLDAESERLVQEALKVLQKGRTTMVIAHRLSTILEADKIVVMEHGKILDIGRHSDLIKREPVYARMVELQFGSDT